MAPEDIRLSLITCFVNVFMRQHSFFMLWSYLGDLCPKKAVFLVPFLVNSFSFIRDVLVWRTRVPVWAISVSLLFKTCQDDSI